jgi:predicted acylesterase/phospholipase RssA
MKIDELRKLRIGVVLAGGGAKGAYQIGCWNVLREYEIRPSMISGSSVGALNAALMATDSFDAGLNLWNELRMFKVMGFKVLRLLVAPVWFLLTGFRLAVKPVRGHTMFGRALFRLRMLYGALFCLYAVPELMPDFSTNGSNAVALVLILFCFDPVIKRITLNWGFTTNTPLQKEVEATFTNERLSKLEVPTFATLSFFKPHVPGSEFWDGWVPMYVRLDQLDFATTRQVLLQSAGIPGLFPVRKVMDQETNDGGWCDNVPVAPLLFRVAERLDVVLVIYLSAGDRKPQLRRGLGLSPKPFTWDINTGLLEISYEAAVNWKVHEAANCPNAPSDWPYSTRAEGGEWLEKISPDDRLPRIVPIVPSTSLGNFLTGTLNFTARKARKLISQGEKDMRKIMEELLQPSWTATDPNTYTLERRFPDWRLVMTGYDLPILPKSERE